MVLPTGLPAAENATDSGASITTLSGSPGSQAIASSRVLRSPKVSSTGESSSTAKPELALLLAKPMSMNAHVPELRCTSALEPAWSCIGCGLRGLTYKLSGRQRQDARPGLAKMYRVPPDWAWWPAVGAPLERGVRRRAVNEATDERSTQVAGTAQPDANRSARISHAKMLACRQVNPRKPACNGKPHRKR